MIGTRVANMSPFLSSVFLPKITPSGRSAADRLRLPDGYGGERPRPRRRRLPKESMGMSDVSASPARRLVLAIDELVAFVTARGTKPKDEKTSPKWLKEGEWDELLELEGKVVGLHTVVAGGKIPFQHRISNY